MAAGQYSSFRDSAPECSPLLPKGRRPLSLPHKKAPARASPRRSAGRWARNPLFLPGPLWLQGVFFNAQLQHILPHRNRGAHLYKVICRYTGKSFVIIPHLGVYGGFVIRNGEIKIILPVEPVRTAADLPAESPQRPRRLQAQTVFSVYIP